MITKTIETFIKKEQELSYFSIPFEVPDGIEKLEIHYSHEGDNASDRHVDYEKNVIDFALRDNNGDDIGTRGNKVRTVVISSTYSTPGYKQRRPVKGTWNLVVGAYMVKSCGFKVTFTINMYETKLRWLKGDLHLHTNNSDGYYTREVLAKMCKDIGLDYMVYTDHNNNTDGAPIPVVDGLTLIRGVELTNYRGHVNFWGLAKPFSGTFAVNTDEELFKHIYEAKEKGAMVSLNHPHCTHCPWLFSFDVPYDCLEIWNGPMRKDNLKTIEYWNELLKSGKHVTAVGGSDYHRDYVVTSLLAEPTTHVLTDCNCQESILQAIKDGHVTISQKPNGTMIELFCEDKPIGSTIKYRKGQQIEIKVNKFKAGMTLHVVDSQGECFTFKARRSGTQTFNVPVRGKGYVWAKVDYEKKGFSRLLHRVVLYFLIRKEAFEDVPPFPTAVANPIYFE